MQTISSLFVITLTTLRVLFPGVPATTGEAPAAQASRSMTFDLYTSDPQLQRAEVAVPESLGVGKAVSLHIDPKDYSAPEPEEPATTEATSQRQLSFWGCAESVPAGQPMVVEPGKPADAATLATPAVPGVPDPPRGRFAYWPGRGDQLIRRTASAPGEYVLMSDSSRAALTLSATQNFLAPIEFVGLDREMNVDKPLKLEWKPVPNARGYLLTVYGGNDKETVEWTSSTQRCDTSTLDLTPISDAQMKKLVDGGIVLPPTATTCTIPAGIFRGASSVVMNFTAFGHDSSQVDTGVTTHVLVRSGATVALLAAPQLFSRD